LKTALKAFLLRLRGYVNRARVGTARAPRFAGVFADHASALASLPADRRAGYDDTVVAPVSFPQMCQVVPWDYPVLFWLDREIGTARTLLDAGGHFGTKYIAFSSRLAVERLTWTVYDLPAIIRAAKTAQSDGQVPAEIIFSDRINGIGVPDILLASGLLQYLDVPFSGLLENIDGKPKTVLLNKVAMRDGPSIVTLELIGPNRVPYHIRNRAAFEAEILRAGYRIQDSWKIPELAHVVATHPWLGPSESRGYLLKML